MVSAGGALKVGELFAALGLDDSEYNKGLDAAERRAGGFGSGVQKASLVAAGAIAAVGAAAGIGLVKSVSAAADYQFAISAVGAVAGATNEELKALNETGLRIGRETAFSATEAASAMEILAANGVSVADILGGAADAAVALAAAGGTDLRTAADLASTAMTVWGLSTSDMTDVVNRLAGAANVSRFGVEDMAMAVAQGGGAAVLAGVEFGDFASAIAAIAPSFASGSDAGTSFKTFLNGLTPSTDAARSAMRSLGILTAEGTNQFFTAEGQLKSMADIVDILHKATEGLNEEQKSQALTTIFGTDAMRAAGALARVSREDFVKLDAVMRGTDAAEVARKRLDNLHGAIEQLKGSIETIEIEIGAVFLPVLTRLANWLAVELPNAFDKVQVAISWMRDHLPEVGAAASILAGVLGAVLAPSFLGLARSAVLLVRTLGPLALGGGLIGALVAGAVLLVMNWDKIIERLPALGQAVDGAGSAIREGFGSAAQFAGSAFTTAFQAVAGFVSGTLVPAFQAFVGLIQAWLLPLLAQATEKFNNDVKPALENIATAIGWAANGIAMVMAPAIEKLMLGLGLLRDLVVGVFGVIVGVITDNAGTFVSILTSAWQTIWSAISLVLELIRDTISIVLAVIRGDWDGAWQGMVTLVSNVLDNLYGIVSGALGLVTGAFELAFGVIESTIKGIFSGIGDWLGNMIGGWIGQIGKLLEMIPAAAYKLIGLDKGDVVGKFQAPTAPTAPATDLASVPRGPEVGSIPNFGGQPRDANGNLLGSLPSSGGNTVIINEQNIGVRPDIPGGIDPAPISAALKEIDFANSGVSGTEG